MAICPGSPQIAAVETIALVRLKPLLLAKAPKLVKLPSRMINGSPKASPIA